jgi:hypothetical protein
MSPYYYVVFVWFEWTGKQHQPETIGVRGAEQCDVYLREQETRWDRYFERNRKLLRTQQPVSEWVMRDLEVPAARTSFYILSQPGGRLMVSAHCVPREKVSAEWELDSKPQPR